MLAGYADSGRNGAGCHSTRRDSTADNDCGRNAIGRTEGQPTYNTLCAYNEEAPMRSSAIGLITGLISGLALAFGGFGDFLIVLIFGAIGLFVGKVLDGDIDINRYVSGGERRDMR